MAEAIDLTTILSDENMLLDPSIETKAELLTTAADLLARTSGLPQDIILKALVDRENLGSTAIGRGIAVPHAGMDALSGPAAAFIRLVPPIDFEAPDNNPVDLVFALIWPSAKRSGLIATLGNLCRVLRDAHLLQELRDATSAAEVRSLLHRAVEEATSPPPEAS